MDMLAEGGYFPMPADGATASPVAEEASAPFLGQWNRLVSTTNWEKGRIIAQWRHALIDAGAPVQEYSDEAWARKVHNVSGQHVGRLRRVHERFGGVAEQFAGLFWSHFQAALDWHDAEMWLEGAVQNDWSVSQMRTSRWEASGSPAAERPLEQDVVMSDVDEDVEPAESSEGAIAVVRPAEDEADETSPRDASDDAPFDETSSPRETMAPVRPFENLPQLPDDLADAFESFKLAIVSHRLTQWSDVAPAHVISALDALKQLVLAPVEAG